jgi:hypothetical protein
MIICNSCYNGEHADCYEEDRFEDERGYHRFWIICDCRLCGHSQSLIRGMSFFMDPRYET